MDRDETELATALAVRGRDEGAKRRLTRLTTVLGVRHASALEYDEAAAALQHEHKPSGLAANGDRLCELFDFEDTERALEGTCAVVRSDGVEPRHRRGGGRWCRRRHSWRGRRRRWRGRRRGWRGRRGHVGGRRANGRRGRRKALRQRRNRWRRGNG